MRLPRWLIRFGFRLLYNELAWMYDVVSWAISLGQWRRWQRAAMPHLTGERVLEVAFGTGGLLIDLAEAGYCPFGLELSPYMMRIAKGKLGRKGLAVPLCRGRAQAMPFADGAFDSLAVTFPADFILEPTALIEMGRVLQPGGRLVIVPGGYLLSHNPVARFMGWLCVIAGRGGPQWAWEEYFYGTGMSVRCEEDPDRLSVAQVIVATKRIMGRCYGGHSGLS